MTSLPALHHGAKFQGGGHPPARRAPFRNFWQQRSRKILRAALLGLLALSPAVQADWATITPQELARSAEIIVTGEYLGQQNQVQVPGATQKLNIGVIRVEQWFKAPMPADAAQAAVAGLPAVVLIVSPLPRPNGAVSSVDVPLKAGQRGLWYLLKQSDGLYRIDRPDRFVSIEAATAQLKGLQPLVPIAATK